MEVNQRALIDKVLARYSGEFTVFRELLQNSDDAQSKAVEIRFETQAYLDLKSTTRASEASVPNVAADDELPDLKTTNVRIFSRLYCATLTYGGVGPLVDVQEQWNHIQRRGLE